MKKIYYYIIASVVLAGINIWVWQITTRIDYQLAWIAFLLVWIDIALSWIVYKKAVTITYFFLSCALIIEILLIVNYYWIQGLGKGL